MMTSNQRVLKVARVQVVSILETVNLPYHNLEHMRRVVGYGDTDFDKEDRILYESPLAQALIGHKVGDKFRQTINGRESEFVIEKVLLITDPELA